MKLVLSSCLLLLLMLSVHVTAQSCLKLLQAQQKEKIELIQTGHFTIKFTNSTTRANRYRVTYKENYGGSIPMIGLSFFYMQGYQDNKGVDFSLRPSSSLKYFDAIFEISQNALWIKVHIHYIASGRPDFVTGIADLAHPKLLEPVQGVQTVKIIAPVGAHALEYIAFVQIAGLKSGQINFNLQLIVDGVSMGNNTLVVPVLMENKLKPIELLSITYFGFVKLSNFSIEVPPSDDFLTNMISLGNNSDSNDYSVAGTVAYNGKNINTNDPIKNIASAAAAGGLRRMMAQESISGPIMRLFKDNVTEEEKRQIYLRLAQDGASEEDLRVARRPEWINTFKKVFNVRYGKLVATATLPARFYQTNDFEPSDPECKCPDGTQFQNGKCVPCRRFTVWDSSTKRCVCIPNSKIDANGQCQPCSIYATYNAANNECVCNPGYTGQGIICRQA